MILYTTTQPTAGFRTHIAAADGGFVVLESQRGAVGNYPHPAHGARVYADFAVALAAVDAA